MYLYDIQFDDKMNNINLTAEKVQKMLTDLESEQIERTISTTDFNKFAQVVCAFSNDLQIGRAHV